MKVYFRSKDIHDEHCGLIPYNYNIANSVHGFHEMGFECHTYRTVNEIYDLYELGDIVLDGIEQVKYCLNKFNIRPNEENYPDILQPYLGRKVWKDTINNINSHPELWNNFVKPIKDKAFTGHIINNPKDLIGCGSCYEDYEVLVSEPVNFIFECRGFVYYNKMIDLRPYKGDWKYMNLIDTKVIEKAMKDWLKWSDRPNVCSLDWGVVQNEDGSYRTLFIEKNSFSATGCYGLDSLSYAKMISGFFAQVSGTYDECNF